MVDLFIDKLCLAIKVPEDNQKDMYRRLREREGFSNDLNLLDERNPSYGATYELKIRMGAMVRVETEPRREGRAALRLDYSPQNIGEDGRGALKALLRDCLGAQYKKCFYAGKVNRMDVSFDVYGVPISDLWVVDLRNNQKSALIRSSTSELETCYFGYSTAYKSCSRQLYVYNKHFERIQAGGSRVRRIRRWVRFEYRYAKGDYCLSELYSRVQNPYNKFSVKQFHPIAGRVDGYDRLLFNSCILLSRSGTLGSLPQGAATTRAERMIDGYPEAKFFQDRQAIWSQLDVRIRDLMH